MFRFTPLASFHSIHHQLGNVIPRYQIGTGEFVMPLVMERAGYHPVQNDLTREAVGEMRYIPASTCVGSGEVYGLFIFGGCGNRLINYRCRVFANGVSVPEGWSAVRRDEVQFGQHARDGSCGHSAVVRK